MTSTNKVLRSRIVDSGRTPQTMLTLSWSRFLFLSIIVIIPSSITSDVCDTPSQSVGRANYICECDKRLEEVIVDCSRSQLEKIPVEGFPQDATNINLRNNKIRKIATNDFFGLTNLRQLTLDHNEIEHIEPNAFRDLSALTVLSMNHNELTRVESRTFHDLVRLQQLGLRNNNIQFIASDSFYFMRDLQVVELEHVRMDCDCQTKRLREWASETYVTLKGVKCSNLNNLPLAEVDDELFGVCPEIDAQMCISCNATSVESCISEGTSVQCQTDSCQMTIDVAAGQQLVISRCRDSRECMASFDINSRSCVNGATYQGCSFCCTGNNCTNDIDLAGYTYRTTLRIRFVIGLWFDQALSSTTSPQFEEMKSRVSEKVNNALSLDTHVLQIESFRPTEHGATLSYLNSTATWPLSADWRRTNERYGTLLKRAIRGQGWGMHVNVHSLMILSPGDPEGIPDAAFCAPDITISEEGIVLWPRTKAGSVAVVACPKPKTTSAMANRSCHLQSSKWGPSYQWGAHDLSECSVPTNVTEQLKDLLETPITNDTVKEITDDLQSLTKDHLSAMDLQFASLLLEGVLRMGICMEKDSAKNVVGIFDNLIAMEEDILVEAQKKFKSIERSLMALDRFSNSLVGVLPSGTITNKLVSVGTLLPVPDMTGGATFQVKTSDQHDFIQKQVSLVVNTTSVPIPMTDASLSIPGAVLHKLKSRLQFVAFSDDKLFRALGNETEEDVLEEGNRADVITKDDSREILQKHVTNGRIMAATFGGIHQEKLPEPVLITFRHKHKHASSPKCVYWKFNATPSGGAWSSNGCRVNRHVTDEYTVCECDHLTNFALLMDIYGTGSEIAKPHRLALSVVSYVGCAISLATLTLTLLTYTIFRKLRKDNPSKLLMNLCAALVMVMILFIVVTQPTVVDNDMACKATAGLLHYFLLAAWCWMAVEAFYMYLALIKIFNTYMTKFMLKCCAVGWGVPAVIVIITVSISGNNYGKQGDICWLARVPFFAACMAPILLILVANFIVFGLVIHQLRKLSLRSTERSVKHYGTKTQLRGAFAVVVLLGLTWVFSIFAIGKASLPFHYLFAICNSLQGLFIFIFYCLMKKDVKSIWREKWTEITSTGSAATKSSRDSTSKYTHSLSPTAEPSSSKVPTPQDVPRAAILRENSRDRSGSMECLNAVEYAEVRVEAVTETET